MRRDLFCRLAGVVLVVPPLRARAAEIEPLARGFVADAAARQGITPPPITEAAFAALRAHAWPGNVRELRSAMERAVLIAEGPIDAADLAPRGALASSAPEAPAFDATTTSAAPASLALPAELEALERRRILDALDQCGGNQTRAAELLGMPRRTLVKRIAHHGLRRPRG